MKSVLIPITLLAAVVGGIAVATHEKEPAPAPTPDPEPTDEEPEPIPDPLPAPDEEQDLDPGTDTLPTITDFYIEGPSGNRWHIDTISVVDGVWTYQVDWDGLLILDYKVEPGSALKILVNKRIDNPTGNMLFDAAVQDMHISVP